MLTIKVVGSGCPTCEKLMQLCREVVEEQGVEARLEKVTDIEQFIELGVYLTPGLIVNDKLVSSGKLPVKATLARWLQDAAQAE